MSEADQNEQTEADGLPWEERSLQDLSYLSPPDTPAEAMERAQARKANPGAAR